MSEKERRPQVHGGKHWKIKAIIRVYDKDREFATSLGIMEASLIERLRNDLVFDLRLGDEDKALVEDLFARIPAKPPRKRGRKPGRGE